MDERRSIDHDAHVRDGRAVRSEEDEVSGTDGAPFHLTSLLIHGTCGSRELDPDIGVAIEHKAGAIETLRC
jgi:hypothetical protein